MVAFPGSLMPGCILLHMQRNPKTVGHFFLSCSIFRDDFDYHTEGVAKSNINPIRTGIFIERVGLGGGIENNIELDMTNCDVIFKSCHQ